MGVVPHLVRGGEIEISHKSSKLSHHTNMFRPSGRSMPELLDNIKSEFDYLAQECNMLKMQRDDYERKLQAQIGELSTMQSALVELERKHSKLKRTYQEEINRLQSNSHLPSDRGSSFNDMRKSEDDRNLPTLLHPSRSEPLSTPTFSFPSATPGLAPLNTAGTLGKRPRDEPPTKFSGKDLPAIHSTHKIHKPDEPVQNTPPPQPPHQPPPVNNPNPNTNGTTPTAKPSPPNVSPLKTSDHERDESPTEAPIVTHVMEDRDDRDYRIGHNPNVQSRLGINLAYELEHNSVVCCVKFSSDGQYLATGCNRKAQIFAVESGDHVNTFTDEAWTGEDLYLRSVCFSPDGKYLACGAEDKTVKVWDIEKEKIYHTFDGHTMDIYSVDYSSDGRFIVSGSGDKKARIWDVEKKKCLFTLGTDEVGPKDGVTSVAISPNGRLIAAGSLDRIVRVWDAETGYFLERYEGHMDSVYSVAFSPDGKSLASGSLDRTLKVWDLSDTRSRSRCRNTFSGHTDFVLSVAFSPDGNWLISGSKDRSVQFWDPRSAITHTKLEGHKNSVISISVNPTNGTFATGSGDCRAKVWRYS